ncbi:MAG: TIGR04211 family SH3 domain-containing protein [Gammaproteobacteria bacterium]|nr:TIGR04211 family SH3 domain-containing protein [Gammaproteobacteria bacterium]
MMKKLLALLCLCLFTTGAQAQTLYVSDQLEIQLRSGASLQHRILRMLPSGTALEVLEVDQAEGWTRVRAPSGVDGWVLSRFLMPERAARDRLAAAEQRVARLEQENRQLNVTIRELRGEKESVAKERGELDQTSRQLAQELEEIRRTASSALALDAENKELKARVLGAEREIQTLQQENARLQDRTARDWFMVGAGVIVLGIIIGLIIPRLRFRRKSSWGEL